MNVTIKKINRLEVVAEVEARVKTWVDEFDEERVWKTTNVLMGIMGFWEIVDGKIAEMDSKIKNASGKHELEEIKKPQKAFKKKIEEFLVLVGMCLASTMPPYKVSTMI